MGGKKRICMYQAALDPDASPIRGVPRPCDPHGRDGPSAWGAPSRRRDVLDPSGDRVLPSPGGIPGGAGRDTAVAVKV